MKDDKELREQLEIILGESHYGSEAYERYRLRLSQPDDWQNFQNDIDSILALLQRKTEEAKREMFSEYELAHLILALKEHYKDEFCTVCVTALEKLEALKRKSK